MAEIADGVPQPESDASTPPESDPSAAVSLTDLRAALAPVVGTAHVFAEERGQEYRVDRQAPPLVVQPGDPEEVAGCLAAADRLGAAVVPWGGGTGQTLGYPPRRYDVALDLRRLNRVLAYEPGDLTISVEAGITVEARDTVLAAHGQRVTVDCPQPRATTLGGLVAT